MPYIPDELTKIITQYVDESKTIKRELVTVIANLIVERNVGLQQSGYRARWKSEGIDYCLQRLFSMFSESDDLDGLLLMIRQRPDY